MFEKINTKYWLLILLSLFSFILNINTDQIGFSAMAIILLVASNKQSDNKSLQLVSKVLVVIVTIITVLKTFFI